MNNTIINNNGGGPLTTEATGLSWFWALLFGPLYFAVWGFWGRAIISLILHGTGVGAIISALMAYPAWRSRARFG